MSFEEIFVDLFDEHADAIRRAVDTHLHEERSGRLVARPGEGLKGQALSQKRRVGTLGVHVDFRDAAELVVDKELLLVAEIEFLRRPVGRPAALADEDVVVELAQVIDRCPRSGTPARPCNALGEPMEQAAGCR